MSAARAIEGHPVAVAAQSVGRHRTYSLDAPICWVVADLEGVHHDQREHNGQDWSSCRIQELFQGLVHGHPARNEQGPEEGQPPWRAERRLRNCHELAPRVPLCSQRPTGSPTTSGKTSGRTA